MWPVPDVMSSPSVRVDDVVPPEAQQLEELFRLRRKFDDGLALCLNLHGERTKLEHELKEKKKVYEEAEQRRRADENGDDGVAAPHAQRLEGRFSFNPSHRLPILIP